LSAASLGFFAVGYLVWESVFDYGAFVARYESGSTKSLFSSLNYASEGWLALIFFGAIALVCAFGAVRSLSRFLSRAPAVEISGERLLIDPTFLRTPKTIPISQIVRVTLTTEGDAASGVQQFATAAAPFGSRWVAKDAQRKICLLIYYRNSDKTEKRIRLSAQFFKGGRWSLGRFGQALRRVIAEQVKVPVYDRREAWTPDRLKK
jgi:hypothetical protein